MSRDPDVWNLLSMFNRPIRMLSSASFTFAPLWEMLRDLAQLSTLVSSDIQIMTWLWLRGVNFADAVKKMLRAEKKSVKDLLLCLEEGKNQQRGHERPQDKPTGSDTQVEDNRKLKFEILKPLKLNRFEKNQTFWKINVFEKVIHWANVMLWKMTFSSIWP